MVDVPESCGYVSRLVPEGAARAMLAWCAAACGSDHDMKDPGKAHCTVMYDTSNPSVHCKALADGTATEITDVALVGPEGDALALSLASEALQARHQELIAAGMRHGYAPYNPHVTLIRSGATSGDLAQAKRRLPELRHMLGGMLPLEAERWLPCPSLRHDEATPASANAKGSLSGTNAPSAS